jgi:uncharacterized membrane protein
MKLIFRRGFFDWRAWALLVPASAVLALDMPVLLTLLYSLSAIFIMVAVAHVIRRVMFPYLDLEEVENQASASPIGAGLVFLGTSLLVSSVIIGAAIWVSR